MSRENILKSISSSQPDLVTLPEMPDFTSGETDLIRKFTDVAVSIGAKVFEVNNKAEIKAHLKSEGKHSGRVISTLAEFQDITEPVDLKSIDPHALENVDVAIIKAEFAVAENSACWVTASSAGERVLPFICQHLVLVVERNAIVATMHRAYERIGNLEYEYATFIAGPSKTADIEQSLVLGAHGPRSLIVFVINDPVGLGRNDS